MTAPPPSRTAIHRAPTLDLDLDLDGGLRVPFALEITKSQKQLRNRKGCLSSSTTIHPLEILPWGSRFVKSRLIPHLVSADVSFRALGNADLSC